MKSIDTLLRTGRTLRVAGFDDAPFEKVPGAPVPVSGIICNGTRMEGMLWGTAHRDGDDATEVIASLLEGSKFHDQVHVVLLDGLAVGGFNLIDLPTLAERLDRPCAAVMRKPPDMPGIRRALDRFEDAERRHALVDRAGEIYNEGPFYFQVKGTTPVEMGRALTHLTDRGHVPEALRLAHLIGAAVITGESSRRA
ncbi:MAG: DUF99 family protein [Bradymonadia bacterium]